jgi:hypothetical protein
LLALSRLLKKVDGARTVFKKIIFVLAVLMISASVGNAAPDSKGTDFWLAFPGQLIPNQLTLFIAGDADTSGNVSIPGLSFSQNFNVTPGQVTVVELPVSAQLSATDGTEDKGIHVTALNEVTVYGLNRGPATTDAYLGLPTDILGLEYIVLGFGNVNIVNGTEFVVAATLDNTTVTITPSVTTGTRTVGTPYNIVLNQGQAYQLRNTGAAPNDLSGTIITADKGVAVFGGHECANIPDGNTVACDHVVEELPPTQTWGKSFVTMPLASRDNGDTFRFLAAVNGTHVTVNGTVVATLNRGQFHQRIIDSPATITSDQPILVAQYSNGCSFDPPCGATDGDPFMMLIPPFEQFLGQYTVSTPDQAGDTTPQFPANFVNVVAPNAAVGSVTLDGTAIPPASFTAIGSSGFSGTQVSLSQGSHTLSGSLPFGAFIYGFGSFDSYGYPGGLSLAPVARVTSVVLTPETATNPVGTEHCVIATVSDQNQQPLAGVRVDFNVIGANPTASFSNTAANGQAQFCYTGANPGQDTIEAAVGNIFDTATKNWTGGETDNTPPVAELQPVVTTPEDTSKLITLTGSDADGDSLTFIIVTLPEHGTLPAPTPATNILRSKARNQLKARLQKERKIRGSSASKLSRKELAALIQSLAANTVTYTPAANYNGPDSFKFKVNDGHADSAEAAVNITVTPVTDPPQIQSLLFEPRTYATPGIAAILKLLNVDDNGSVGLTVTQLKARNVPKGCGPDVVSSDEFSLFPFSEVASLVDDPDSADPTRSEAELKAVEIGPDALAVATAQGCAITLELTAFSVRRTGSSTDFSGTFSIDSDGGTAAAVSIRAPATSSSQVRSNKTAKKLPGPAVR